eukprot:TRINITY_DN15617_c0_g1_i1.p2 TRINITY_DN15617_c0_g1~~TRINITY_DN15617_c0_g1_i1.p2  ORF type:complete len:166 (-),score=22.78 TRINITY_DN15617_c0_g1_i1:315-812(-)
MRDVGTPAWPLVHRWVIDVANFEMLSLSEDESGKVYASWYGFNPAGVLQTQGVSIFQRPSRPGSDAMVLLSIRSLKIRQGAGAPAGFAAPPGSGPMGVALAKLSVFFWALTGQPSCRRHCSRRRPGGRADGQHRRPRRLRELVVVLSNVYIGRRGGALAVEDDSR